jgi:hypothetical protein
VKELAMKFIPGFLFILLICSTSGKGMCEVVPAWLVPKNFSVMYVVKMSTKEMRIW